MKSMRADHEHEFEVQHGLPEALPAGEHVLWQGSPEWWQLAVRAFHARQLAAYFATIVLVRVGVVLAAEGTALQALASAAWLTALFGVGLAIVLVMAKLSASTTVYTITNRRVVMRVGIVLSLTFNLPLKTIQTAALRAGARNTGDIPLTLNGRDRIAFLHLWPHARPWRIAHPEPMLRCVPDAQAVATLLCNAWSQAQALSASVPQSTAHGALRRAPEQAPGPSGERQPVMAVR